LSQNFSFRALFQTDFRKATFPENPKDLFKNKNQQNEHFDELKFDLFEFYKNVKLKLTKSFLVSRLNLTRSPHFSSSLIFSSFRLHDSFENLIIAFYRVFAIEI